MYPQSAECKYCVQYQVKETNHHEHDSPPISALLITRMKEKEEMNVMP